MAIKHFLFIDMAGNIFISHSPGLIWTHNRVFLGLLEDSGQDESTCLEETDLFLASNLISVSFLSASQVKMEGYVLRFFPRNRLSGIIYPRDSPAPKALTDNPDWVYLSFKRLPAFHSQETFSLLGVFLHSSAPACP